MFDNVWSLGTTTLSGSIQDTLYVAGILQERNSLGHFFGRHWKLQLWPSRGRKKHQWKCVDFLTVRTAQAKRTPLRFPRDLPALDFALPTVCTPSGGGRGEAQWLSEEPRLFHPCLWTSLRPRLGASYSCQYCSDVVLRSPIADSPMTSRRTRKAWPRTLNARASPGPTWLTLVRGTHGTDVTQRWIPNGSDTNTVANKENELENEKWLKDGVAADGK